MKLSVEEFRQREHKAVTLLGMSGVGKTYLAAKLRQADWFHYSGDYRIGTRYLDEPILDNIKQQAMQVPFLRDLLRADAIYIRNNLSVDNLKPVSSFLGKLGDPAQGGVPLDLFEHRQQLHHRAEIAAMQDVPDFIRKAHDVYGYRHFINDAGGSLCELDDEAVYSLLDAHTVFLYIKASEEDIAAILKRAETDPKPLYFRAPFLASELAAYLAEQRLEYAAQMDPNDFTRWVFPRLFHERLPRYESLASRFGYAVSSAEVAAVSDEESFVELICEAIAREQ